MDDETVTLDRDTTPTIAELAAMGAEAIAKVLSRALPSAEGQVGVAAFNSSI